MKNLKNVQSDIRDIQKELIIILKKGGLSDCHEQKLKTEISNIFTVLDDLEEIRINFSEKV